MEMLFIFYLVHVGAARVCEIDNEFDDEIDKSKNYIIKKYRPARFFWLFYGLYFIYFYRRGGTCL